MRITTYLRAVAVIAGLVAAAAGAPAAGAGSASAASALPAPGGLAASVAEQPPAPPVVEPQGKIIVSWTDVPGATGYQLYRGTSPGGEAPYGGAVPPTAFALTGEENAFADAGVLGTTYYYEVRAIGVGGQLSPLSNEVSVAYVLAAPSGVETSAAPGQVAISWNAAPAAASYSVYDATTRGGENLSGPAACVTSSTSCVVTALTSGTAYSFVVVASGPGPASPPSAEVTATPGAPAPALLATQYAIDGVTRTASSAVFGEPDAPGSLSPSYALSLASVPAAPVEVEVTTSTPMLALASTAPNFVTLQTPQGNQPGEYLVVFTPADAEIPVDMRISANTSCPQSAASITNSVVAGSPEYLAVPARTLPVSINAGYPACAVSLTASVDPVNPNAAVTYDATVTPFGGTVFVGAGLTYLPQSGPSGGVITFSDDGVPIPGCTALPTAPNAAASSGQATAATATCIQSYPATGHHLIGAAYYSFGDQSRGAFQAAPLDGGAAVGETVARCGATTAGCNLKAADFTSDSLVAADLAGANLNGADAEYADLSGANLSGANLLGVDFTGANLHGAVTKGANFNKAVWSNTTCPDGTNSSVDNGTCSGHV